MIISTRSFFPENHKSAHFPLQMLHKILITKLFNNLILPAIQLYVPLQQGQKPTMQSLWTPQSLRDTSPQTNMTAAVFKEETELINF